MLPEIEFPEIFIGIVAPVGVRTADSIDEIKTYFKSIGYNPIEIKVTASFSRFIRKINPKINLEKGSYLQRIKSHIAYGNQLREETK